MDFTTDDIESLGDKLAGLDLTDGEAEALRTIVAIAADTSGDDDVTGFFYDEVEIHFRADFGSLGLKLGPPTRFASADLGGTRIVNMGDGEEI